MSTETELREKYYSPMMRLAQVLAQNVPLMRRVRRDIPELGIFGVIRNEMLRAGIAPERDISDETSTTLLGESVICIAKHTSEYIGVIDLFSSMPPRPDAKIMGDILAYDFYGLPKDNLLAVYGVADQNQDGKKPSIARRVRMISQKRKAQPRFRDEALKNAETYRRAITTLDGGGMVLAMPDGGYGVGDVKWPRRLGNLVNLVASEANLKLVFAHVPVRSNRALAALFPGGGRLVLKKERTVTVHFSEPILGNRIKQKLGIEKASKPNDVKLTETLQRAYELWAAEIEKEGHRVSLEPFI